MTKKEGQCDATHIGHNLFYLSQRIKLMKKTTI